MAKLSARARYNIRMKIPRKASYRQLTALVFWLGSRTKNKAEALREAGYGAAVIRNPDRVFGSPLVLKELELRGFGADGRRLPPVRVVEIQAPASVPDYAFEKMIMEDRQTLKERLEAVEGVRFRPSVQEREEIDPNIPLRGGADIFNAHEEDGGTTNSSQFSSM